MYSIDKVPTFLLYDALSWMIKTGANKTLFYRAQDGKKEESVADAEEIKSELERREQEIPDFSISCQRCGEHTDGRTVWGEPPRKPICAKCYFSNLAELAGGSPEKVLSFEDKAKKIHKYAEKIIQHTETREETAQRLGVPVEVLEENGYFET